MNPIDVQQEELVERDAELRQLSQLLGRLREGRGQVVFLSGAAGRGKSALARAFLQRLQTVDPTALALTAGCTEGVSEHRPFGPFRDLLRRLEAAAGPSVPGSDRARIWLRGDAEVGTREDLLEGYLAVWRDAAVDRPIVLFIDDWQWSDRSSLDLLLKLGSSLGRLPVLIVVAFDTELVEQGPGLPEIHRQLGAHAVEIPVRELSEAGIRTFLRARLGRAPTRGLVRWMSDRTRGNPLHIGQLLGLLIDVGAVRRRFLRYGVREEAVPPGVTRIQDVIDARVARLDPSVRWSLGAAACAGPVIEPQVVARQLEASEQTVLEHLREAERRYGFLESAGELRESSGEVCMRYRLANPLLRQVLRARVTPGRRERLTRRAVEAIVEIGERRDLEVADAVAALLLTGGPEEVVHEWCLRAAEIGRRLHAYPELERLLQEAARTAPNPRVRARVQNRIAALYLELGREVESEELLGEVFERCRELDDRAAEVEAGARLGWLQLERGEQPSRLGALAGRLVDSARQSGGPTELVNALDFACAVAIRIGRAEEALLMAEEAVHVADDAADPRLTARAAHRLARVHVSFESPEAAHALARRALEIFSELMEASREVVGCHELLGLADFRAGRWEEALEHWRTAGGILEEEEFTEERLRMQVRVAELETLRGQFEPARERLRAALSRARELTNPAPAFRVRTSLARLQFEEGDYAGVVDWTDAIRRDLPETGFWREEFVITAIRALSYLHLGDELQAWQEAAALEQLYQGKEGWFEGRAEGDAVRLRVIDLDADPGLASMIADQAIRELEGKDPYGEAFLQYHRAVVMSRTDRATARRSIERAVELLERLGARPMLERARSLSAEIEAGDDRTVAPSPEPGEEAMLDESIDRWFDALEE